MKLNKLTQQEAEKIIVYGKGGGFSMIKPANIPLTIYHRIYEGKRYHIAEMNTHGFNGEGEEITVTTFYELDEKEVIQMLGLESDYFEKYQSESV